MPMHLAVSDLGHITHIGPTLAKLFPNNHVLGKRVLELFQFRRPRNVASVADLRAAAGSTLSLQLRIGPFTNFKGVLVEQVGDKGLLINLSFGIAVADAVRDHSLTNADFAPTELATEMLYLIEAKTAVMNESRNLNMRLQGARVAAEEQAFTDTLTGLKNRRALDHILGRLAAGPSEFGMMQIDLDYFKRVNDTLGHAAGDMVLQRVAAILIEETRMEDTTARIGGDEFIIIFNRLTDVQRLLVIGERIIKRLEEPMQYNDQPCQISGSVGLVTSSMYHQLDCARMLTDADAALYRSKDAGRGQVTLANVEIAKRKKTKKCS